MPKRIIIIGGVKSRDFCSSQSKKKIECSDYYL
jgi:hypothetical protein